MDSVQRSYRSNTTARDGMSYSRSQSDLNGGDSRFGNIEIMDKPQEIFHQNQAINKLEYLNQQTINMSSQG